MSPAFMLVVVHEPMFNPAVWFEWPPSYFRWYWLAWLAGLWMLTTRPYATGARIYRRNP